MPLHKRPHGKGGRGQRPDEIRHKRMLGEIARAMARGYQPAPDKSTAHGDVGRMLSKIFMGRRATRKRQQHRRRSGRIR